MRQGPVNESSLYNYMIVITAEAGYDGMSRKAGTDVFVIYKYIKNRYSPQYTIIQQMTFYVQNKFCQFSGLIFRFIPLLIFVFHFYTQHK